MLSKVQNPSFCKHPPTRPPPVNAPALPIAELSLCSADSSLSRLIRANDWLIFRMMLLLGLPASTKRALDESTEVIEKGMEIRLQAKEIK